MPYNLIESQLRDALHYAAGLRQINETSADDPGWGEGMRLVLPEVIPLRGDYPGEPAYAWLVTNDFNGYDLTTVDPAKED